MMYLLDDDHPIRQADRRVAKAQRDIIKILEDARKFYALPQSEALRVADVLTMLQATRFDLIEAERRANFFESPYQPKPDAAELHKPKAPVVSED